MFFVSFFNVPILLKLLVNCCVFQLSKALALNISVFSFLVIEAFPSGRSFLNPVYFLIIVFLTVFKLFKVNSNFNSKSPVSSLGINVYLTSKSFVLNFSSKSS